MALNILKLPTEVRQLIWKHYFAGTKLILHGRSVQEYHQRMYPPLGSPSWTNETGILNLVSVNSQIRHEAIPILYDVGCFEIKHCSCWEWSTGTFVDPRHSILPDGFDIAHIKRVVRSWDSSTGIFIYTASPYLSVAGFCLDELVIEAPLRWWYAFEHMLLLGELIPNLTQRLVIKFTSDQQILGPKNQFIALSPGTQIKIHASMPYMNTKVVEIEYCDEAGLAMAEHVDQEYQLFMNKYKHKMDPNVKYSIRKVRSGRKIRAMNLRSQDK